MQPGRVLVTRPTTMFMHGFGANTDNFTHVALYLMPRYGVIISGHKGFGESAHPYLAYWLVK